jgi:general nucleoside transport system ATP-binding protein
VNQPLRLELSGVTKVFGTLRAVDDVSLRVTPAEVHAVLGENGAGKSTLMKLVHGTHRADSGTISIDGNAVEPGSPNASRTAGVGMVFQDLRLIPALTVAENIGLAIPKQRRYNLTRLERAITESCDRFGLQVDPRARVRDLSLGERQRVEICKVLMAGASLLILDEPTSVLAPQEVDALFASIESLTNQGMSVLIITHKLAEARAVADRLTVLRGGRVTLAGSTPSGVTDAELIEAMVGRTVAPLAMERPRLAAALPPALELRGVSIIGSDNRLLLDSVDLCVDAGEIVGVAGLAGNGQRDLADVAIGAARVKSGEVKISSQTIRTGRPAEARAAGVVNVPEDPIADAVVPGLTVHEHIALEQLAEHRRGLRVDWVRVAKTHAEMDRVTELRVAAGDRVVSDLSGGNVQRVMLARSLALQAPLIVASYPSRGLDIATTRRTQELLIRRRNEGAGVLLVSEDIDELIEVADRIVVVREGRIVGELATHNIDRMAVGALMLGEAA